MPPAAPYSLLWTHPTTQGLPLDERTRELVAHAPSSTVLVEDLAYASAPGLREILARATGQIAVIVSTDGSFGPDELTSGFSSPFVGIGGQFGRCALRAYASLIRAFVRSDAASLDYRIPIADMAVDVDLHLQEFTCGIADIESRAPFLQVAAIPPSRRAALRRRYPFTRTCLSTLQEIAGERRLAKDKRYLDILVKSYVSCAAHLGVAASASYDAGAIVVASTRHLQYPQTR